MIDFLQKNCSFSILKIEKLNGYENENYLIKTNSKNYIFKTYLYSKQELDVIEAQNKTLVFLQKNDQKNIPHSIAFDDGSYIKVCYLKGQKSICRILSFLEGDFLGDVIHTRKLFESFGVFLAEMDIKLQQFDNTTIKARQFEWDLQYFHLNKKFIPDIADTKNRSIVKYFFEQFEEHVAPSLPTLRKSIIHNDANEWNVLTNEGKVSGIIDFGDLAYTQLINELAIAITYACYGKENPIEWACFILKSYHTILPIREKEVSILYYLIAARLCTSICNAAHSKKINPANEYAYSGKRSATELLHRLHHINPLVAENAFRSTLLFEQVRSDK